MLHRRNGKDATAKNETLVQDDQAKGVGIFIPSEALLPTVRNELARKKLIGRKLAEKKLAEKKLADRTVPPDRIKA